MTLEHWICMADVVLGVANIAFVPVTRTYVSAGIGLASIIIGIVGLSPQ